MMSNVQCPKSNVRTGLWTLDFGLWTFASVSDELGETIFIVNRDLNFQNVAGKFEGERGKLYRILCGCYQAFRPGGLGLLNQRVDVRLLVMMVVRERAS